MLFLREIIETKIKAQKHNAINYKSIPLKSTCRQNNLLHINLCERQLEFNVTKLSNQIGNEHIIYNFIT